jgi:hypothetical protein
MPRGKKAAAAMRAVGYTCAEAGVTTTTVIPLAYLHDTKPGSIPPQTGSDRYLDRYSGRPDF